MNEQVKKLLEASLYAFNAIPNKQILYGDFRYTYDIAAAISKLLKENDGNKVG